MRLTPARTYTSAAALPNLSERCRVACRRAELATGDSGRVTAQEQPPVHRGRTPDRTGALRRVQLTNVMRYSSYLRAGVLRRGGFKLRDPLNFPDWQAAAGAQVPYSTDLFLNWRFYSIYAGGCVTDLGCQALDGIHMLTGAAFSASVKASGARSAEQVLGHRSQSNTRMD
jgi:hypothetical protein